ncbi:MAG: hypothetical protein COX44_01305 [Candidatus Portnoybacteria bacterium CG23_combo_of_CG06-09_8_20_14_all_37_13]|uniref:Uncharacterized protein n=1 Tax=Candidatus Portnoybacteria bacterium CG23_combo_of_CG06-09_8_20_14_all_37_13 TaxID=1974819 RepID=A0A2G9YD79_9BACT|nr:MAG: hypothetical protein COX44_01305 [Candidatus Portnoybacteria bacterium CG23_combo_of_CG06-09_8_20_14_all_37_13]
MKEKIKNFIKGVTAKQLIIFIIVYLVFVNVWDEWLRSWLFDIIPMPRIADIIFWQVLFEKFEIILGTSFFIALIWLIIKGLKRLWKKDYERKN